jgi:Putative porin
MFNKKPDARRGLMPLAVSLCALVCTVPAFAQSASDQGDATVNKSDKKNDSKKPSVSRAKPTSPNATIDLINTLVEQGILTEQQAQALIKKADDEAYVTREASKTATTKADDAAKAAAAAAAAANPPGTRHVTYVPEIVKRELREEIKQEVMAKAEKENWASPGAYPEWAQRIHFSGDMRVRYQGNFFPGGNDQGNAVNFNAINSGSPFDVSNANTAFPPTLDATQNRNYLQIRGRLAMDADLYNGFSAGLRLATGNSSSPVSTNQTLGSVASGGDFSKYSVWLDRGFIKYRAWEDNLVVAVGRFDNPFWSPTDLVWYRELGFDGFAVQAKYEVTKDITPFAVAGAFPIYNTDLNAGINLADPSTGQPTKLSNDKWLFGGQVGFADRFAPESSFRLAVAYYDFEGVQGQVSTPCSVLSSSDVCDTDLLRPAFAQYGNTYMPLRNIIANAANNFGQINQFQYFGLASAFRPLVGSGQVDFGDFHPVHVVLDGEFVWNSAFNRDAIAAVAVNNLAGTTTGALGAYNGGSMGALGRITVGDKEIKHLWDWNVHAGYKYLESDATVDAFVDSDFGLGGTNLKGYFIGGNVGLSENVWATLRWMSATNIAGSPYAVDILQVDVNARF